MYLYSTPVISPFRPCHLPSKLIKFPYFFFLILQPEIICIKSTSCFVFLNSFRSTSKCLCSGVAIEKCSSVSGTAPDKYRSLPISCCNRGNDPSSGTLRAVSNLLSCNFTNFKLLYINFSYSLVYIFSDNLLPLCLFHSFPMRMKDDVTMNMISKFLFKLSYGKEIKEI